MNGQTTKPDPADAGALEEYRPYLLHYALLQLRDNTLADDAVQETLLAALESRSKFSGRSSTKTWLTGILKHKIIDLFRKQAKETSMQVSFEAELQGESDFDTLFNQAGAWSTPPQEWADPLKSLENKKFWEIFEVCTKLMSINTARVFMMREFLGLSTKEICKDMQISATNCWVMLYRARMSLRLCLEHNWFGGHIEER
ncbi:MAG: sigma-70 family RNA polymerase sigma factor [Burkholderiales bacterium]